LILQTTTASLDLTTVISEPLGEVCVEMRLDALKCGQMGVRFDYYADFQDRGRVRFAKGYQKMSSKRRNDQGIIPCALPAELLDALRQFAGTDALLAKIDDVLEFAESSDLHPQSVSDSQVSG
jgi:hypothetical protein